MFLVLDPPRSVSVSISPSGEIVEGDSVTLSCSSDSNPPAEISWFKGGETVGSGRIYSISKIRSDHSGEYKCKSINEHGDKYSAATLNVMCELMITFTFMHLVDTFIQSDLHSGHTYFCQCMCSLGIEPTTFALLTQCSNH